jgi:hypothetical protein
MRPSIWAAGMKTVEFRDGEKDVPDHVAVLMQGLRTWEITYDQAMALAHQNQLRQALDATQRSMIRQHFKKNGPTT